MNIAFLRPLFERTGAWASVYLDDSRDTPDARHEVEQRWREARRQLTVAGAPAVTLDAAESAVHAGIGLPGRHGLALFADDRGAVFTFWLPAPPPATTARYARVPFVLPLLRTRGEQVCWLRVAVDPSGATIEYAAAGSVPRRTDLRGNDLHGSTGHAPERYPIRPVSPDEWTAGRPGAEAEGTWQRNAAEAAEAVAQYAETIGADAVVIAGEPHARRLLQSRLPIRWQLESVLTDGGSSAGTAADDGISGGAGIGGAGIYEEALDEATARMVVDIAEARDARLLGRFHDNDGLWAVRGREATDIALQRAQADTLLLEFDGDLTGPDTDALAAGADEPAGHGDETAGHRTPEANEAAGANELVREAALTQADVLILEPGREDLRDGVGALLRYADPATTG